MDFWIAMANNHPDALDCSCYNITPPAFNTVSSMCFIQKLYKQKDTMLSFFFFTTVACLFFSEAILMWFPYVFWTSSYSLDNLSITISLSAFSAKIPPKICCLAH